MTIHFLFKRYVALFLLVLMAGCSTMPRGGPSPTKPLSPEEASAAQAKSKADQAERNLQSNICRGKVDATGLRKLNDFVAQPTAFFCNMSRKMVLALEHQYRALGDLDREAQAKQTREKLENGVYGPSSVGALMVSLAPTEEQKSLYLQRLQNDADGSKKREMQLARAEMQAANREFALGMASVAVKTADAVKSLKDAKKANKEKKGMEQTLAIMKVVSATAEIAQIVQLSGGLRQASVQWEINNKHLERISGYENYAFAGEKPEIPSGALESDDS
jgi:hypothetical protein